MLNVLLENLPSNGKSCHLKCIPACINNEGNECADTLLKEASDDDQPCNNIKFADANSAVKNRLLFHIFKGTHTH